MDQFKEFSKIHYEFTGVFICSNLGDILFTTPSVDFTKEECKIILESWLHSRKELILRDTRYTILKTDIYQYAALNPQLKKGIVGSMDREYNYAIGFVDSEANPENSLLISSIELNKLVWSTKE